MEYVEYDDHGRIIRMLSNDTTFEKVDPVVQDQAFHFKRSLVWEIALIKADANFS